MDQIGNEARLSSRNLNSPRMLRPSPGSMTYDPRNRAVMLAIGSSTRMIQCELERNVRPISAISNRLANRQQQTQSRSHKC